MALTSSAASARPTARRFSPRVDTSRLLTLRDQLADTTFVKRGALTLCYAPYRVFWHDLHVHLCPQEAVVMASLIRRGRATHQDLQSAVVGAGGLPNNMNVLMHQIRRRFAAIGARDPLRTVRGWGYELDVEEDAWGSKTLVIPGIRDIGRSCGGS